MTAQNNDEKRDAVDVALSNWRQGDCVIGEHWFVYRVTPDTPLTDGAIVAASQGVELAETEVVGFTVVTQTCDIVRSCAERPYVEIAPLVGIDESDLRTIERGRRPRYAFIPGVKDRRLVVDLDRAMTVEKGVVAAWTRIPGCGTDQEIRALGYALARKRTRWAFPYDFTRLVGNLQTRLQEKHDKQSEEGAALRALREIRVRAAPSWDSDSVNVMFWFIRDRNELNFQGRSWDKLLESWLKLVRANGRFDPVDGTVVSLDDLTARDYVESDPLDLDHLSSRLN